MLRDASYPATVTGESRPLRSEKGVSGCLFECTNAPGDVMVLSRALHALQSVFDGPIYYKGTAPEILENTGVRLHGWSSKDHVFRPRANKAVTRANSTALHYAKGYVEELEQLTGLEIPLRDIRPHLRLSEKETEEPPPVPGPYVIIAPGWKQDMPVKAWSPKHWQALVDKLLHIVPVVQVGGNSPRHRNPELKGTVNLVGKTGIRRLLSLVAGSSCAVSGVSMLMHAAAGLNRPCVVLAGGREPWWWTAYTRSVFEATTGLPIPEDFVPHDFLDSIGAMDCCKSRGCWKYTLEGRTKCLHLVPSNDRPYAQCLHEISPDLVFSRVLAAMEGIEFGKAIPASLTRETGISATENSQKRV